MYDVKFYAFTLFCCSMAVALIEFLVPSGAKKQISYITGMVLLIAILTPAIKLLDEVLSLNTDTDTGKTDMISAEDIIEEQFEYNLTGMIKDKLEQVGIFAEDIGIEIIMSDDEVTIGYIEVILNDADRDKAGNVKKMLEEYMKINITVKAAGGENIEK